MRVTAKIGRIVFVGPVEERSGGSQAFGGLGLLVSTENGFAGPLFVTHMRRLLV